MARPRIFGSCNSARGATTCLFPLFLQRQFPNPPLYIRTIEIRTLPLNDPRRVFDLSVGFPHLCPFELRDEDIFRSSDKHTDPCHRMRLPSFEFNATEL